MRGGKPSKLDGTSEEFLAANSILQIPGPILKNVEHKEKESIPERYLAGSKGKVLNLNYFRIKKSLEKEGFDLITGKDGRLTVVLRVPGSRPFR